MTRKVTRPAARRRSTDPLTGSQIVWECLVREGVTHVFGYPGGAILPVYDAMPAYPVHHVLARHEQGAVHMADGYARAAGGVGVAMATSGPGATNMVTGIATAMMDSSPVVCITGQVSSALIGSDAFQETDITGVTLPITKHNYLVTDVDEIAPVLREAFYIARSGRPGPVLVDIAKDAQQGSCPFDWDAAEPKPPGYRPDHRPRAAELRHALELINESKRPLMLVGHGVVLGQAEALVRAFAERTTIPVAMTLLGIGAFPASHPLNLGMMGMHGEAWVNEAVQQADLLIALGMRFDDRVTGSLSTFAPGARKIHVEIDPAEVNKNVPVDVGLIGDVHKVLGDLLPGVVPNDHSAWLARIDELRQCATARGIQNFADDGRLYAAHAIHDLWKATGGGALVVTDVGQHQMWEAQYYRHEAPRSLITSGGLGPMGFALPAAIGAKLARPDADVWAVVGDGGFQMTMAELGTMVQEGVKVNIAIINNGYLGMVRQLQEFFYGARYHATPLVNPDFVTLASAYGIRGIRVTERSQVIPAVDAAAADAGPVLLDIRVEADDAVYPMVAAGAGLDQMIRRPAQEVVE
ncbi:MAG: biosynthetic-type acetolactate synthase large subunit [Acidobacteria bacterium]|nr:biosynthetic-type acetolactate synthase large subunit [Acidobacteriota bacterium]